MSDHPLQRSSVLSPDAGSGIGPDVDLLPLYLLRFESANTKRSYANDLRQFFQSEFITLEMARHVQFVHVNGHLADLSAAEARPTTIQRRVAALRGFFAWLIALGVLAQNPADRHLIRKVRRTSRRDRVLTVLSHEQARALVDSINPASESAVRDRVLILVLLHCVLRRSEAQAMDFHHIRRVGEHSVLDLPVTKGGANQYVKLTPYIYGAMNRYKEYYEYEEGPVWRSLSNNSRGARLSSGSIYNIVHEAAAKAGIPEIVGAHTLRHTGCTLAIEAGATLQQVQAHARHKNLETTMIYVHQRDRLKDSAADYINVK